MKAKLKSSFNYTVAILLIILGIMGWVLPVMPGLILVVAGIIILSIENPKLEHYIEKNFSKYPKAEKIFLRLRDKIHSIFG
jgi:uncharacterized membrane protein YbaN (DUF454 family)